jgi:hypothetical protein
MAVRHRALRAERRGYVDLYHAARTCGRGKEGDESTRSCCGGRTQAVRPPRGFGDSGGHSEKGHPRVCQGMGRRSHHDRLSPIKRCKPFSPRQRGPCGSSYRTLFG